MEGAAPTPPAPSRGRGRSAIPDRGRSRNLKGLRRLAAYLVPYRARAAGALLALTLAVSSSSAQQQYCPPRPIYVPQAPNACGPGSYYYNDCGLLYGPYYCLRPGFQPFQGMIKGPPGPGPVKPLAGSPPPPQMLKQYSPKQLAAMERAPGMPAMIRLQGPPPLPGLPQVPYPAPPRYISHPFARSPRDFFMLD